MEKQMPHWFRTVFILLILPVLSGQAEPAKSESDGWYTRGHKYIQKETPGAKVSLLKLHIFKGDQKKCWRFGGGDSLDEDGFRTFLRKFASYGLDAVMVYADDEVTVARLVQTLAILEEEKFKKVLLFNRVRELRNARKPTLSRTNLDF